jgi:transposase
MDETARADVIVGVDTHKHVHAAVAIDALGARLGATTVPVGERGYRVLEAWARSLGPIRAFGVEGTGSYGAGLSRFLVAQGHAVLEVNRPDRQPRRRKGKGDPLDAESAARAVLGGQATARPKSGTGTVEMIRHLKVARDTAVEGRTRAMVTLKAIIVGAPAALRERLDRITGKMALIRHLAALRPGPITSTTASAKAGLRAIARRWLALDEEIRGHDAHLERLTAARAGPGTRDGAGHGRGDAAARRRQPGADPLGGRVREAVRRLPDPCLERQDDPPPARPRRRQAGQRRPPPGRRHPRARPPADPRLRPQAYGRGEDEAGDHALPEALRRPRDLRLPLRYAEAGGSVHRSRLTDIGASTLGRARRRRRRGSGREPALARCSPASPPATPPDRGRRRGGNHTPRSRRTPARTGHRLRRRR